MKTYYWGDSWRRIFSLCLCYDLCLVSDGLGTQNPDFIFWKCHGEMGLRQVELSFSSFFAKKLGIFDYFSKFQCLFHSPFRKIIKYVYAKNLAKNEEKPCSNCLKPFFGWFRVRENRISGTRTITKSYCALSDLKENERGVLTIYVLQMASN